MKSLSRGKRILQLLSSAEEKKKSGINEPKKDGNLSSEFPKAPLSLVDNDSKLVMPNNSESSRRPESDAFVTSYFVNTSKSPSKPPLSLVDNNSKLGMPNNSESSGRPESDAFATSSFVNTSKAPLSHVDNNSKLGMPNNSESSGRPESDAFFTSSFVNTSKSCLKRYFCIYCKKTVVKLPRHIIQMHSNEPDVRIVLALPKKCPERMKVLEKIRLKGSFEFNTNSEYNNGELIVSRRPSKNNNRDSDYYIPCIKCKCYFSKVTIHRHIRKCQNLVNDRRYNGCRFFQTEGRMMARQIHPKANEIMVEKICPPLNPGPVRATICSDELIILFGNKLTYKYRQPHLYYHIRQILRTVAKFLLEMKKIDQNIDELCKVYDAKNYNSVLMAVNNLAKFNATTNEYDVPSMATRLGNYINKCGNLLATECIKNSDLEKKKIVKDFLKVHAEDYGPYVNKTAIETQRKLKRNKPLDLPVHNDVKKLHEFLNNETKIHFNQLKKHFSYASWTRLSKCVLTAVQLFNRKRPGEIERLLITDFQNRQSIDKEKHSDLYKTLSKMEQLLAEKYVKIELRGKLGRSVPILLSLEQVETINIILLNRENAQVDELNEFVFGCPGGRDKFFRACVSLREFSVQCGADNPESLRGTKLRKQIATITQILNLNENELQQLANFMGHDIRIHTDHYRLPSTALQIGQLSKLFIMMENGDMDKHKGKNLRQINISDDNLDDSSNDKCMDNFTSDNIICSPTPTISKVNTTPRKSVKATSTITSQVSRKKRLAPVSPMGKVRRVTWITPERHAARKYFSTYLEHGTLPSDAECAEVIKKEPRLQSRSVRQLKAWINNQCKRKLKFSEERE